MTASSDSSKISDTSKESRKHSSPLVLIVGFAWPMHFSISARMFSFYEPAIILGSPLSMKAYSASRHFSRDPGLLSPRYFFQFPQWSLNESSIEDLAFLNISVISSYAFALACQFLLTILYSSGPVASEAELLPPAALYYSSDGGPPPPEPPPIG